MVASSSSFLLAVATVRALLAIGSCGTVVTFTVGKGSSSPFRLVLVTNIYVAKIEIKEYGANYWRELTQGPVMTWTIDSTAPLRGPVTVRFLKNGSYRVLNNLIPDNFKGWLYFKGLGANSMSWALKALYIGIFDVL
ncbi:hypothetical protein E2562_017610 [Oryza meyeriana var. granulata]|uniref:Expansin-like CBD domain-containing protein n=1 Tax=Oryza meyeriana var. granulata TaxID=110450 RepID=A0A6G1BXC1_9ORYZ|nr:hypothetical protein E2562_017610 [Oryza meyeriana var. granulata]